jgi:hypothetical protein
MKKKKEKEKEKDLHSLYNELSPNEFNRSCRRTWILTTGKDAEGMVFENFPVVCAVPDSDRLRKLPIPRLGRYVQVLGMYTQLCITHRPCF